jgi:hypothetical protein
MSFNNNVVIGGVMVSMLDLRAVDLWFEPRPSQTKDYKIGICCFSAKHASLKIISFKKIIDSGLYTCGYILMGVVFRS